MNKMLCKLVEHHDILIIVRGIECINCGRLNAMKLHGEGPVPFPVLCYKACIGGTLLTPSRCNRCRTALTVIEWERYDGKEEGVDD